MNIPRYDEVALLIMLELAENYGKGNISLSQIAVDHGISVMFLKKIARHLIGAKLLISKEGSNGGYVLSRPPGEITLWNIISAFSSDLYRETKYKIKVTDCPIRLGCLPQQVHLAIDRAMESGFSVITLASLSRKD
jgi:Rrf2 family transcriptional regulator, cysteine metabolism repressor